MSDKKHIDRLFQEAFKDFEETPNDAVWEHIASKLKEKKKRRVIPIWWRYAGVAALLLLLLTIGNGVFNNSEDPSVVLPSNQVVDTDTNSDGSNITNEEDSSSSNSSTETKNATSIANTPSNTSDKGSTSPKAASTKGGVLHKPNSTPSLATNSGTHNTDGLQQTGNINQDHQKKAATQNDNRMANTSEDKTTATPEANSEGVVDTNRLASDLNNATKNEALAKNNKPEQKKSGEKSIEEAIEDTKNTKEDEKETFSRWSVAPNAAPVFFNTLGQGSSIDPQFNSNTKNTEPNVSYGITASYAVNEKLRIRSGVNKVNLGYSTNDVVVLHSLNGTSSLSFLGNVKPELSNASNDVSLLSSQNFANKSSQSFASTTGVSTSINQSFSFIEIPLELEYALIDKKVGLNVIGGFSSFFLNANKLTTDFEGRETTIGEANNINDVSYSANFGLGLSYQFSKKINLNLEPMFKYQINTFSNTSGDFKPYFIGVYTGFGIKF